MLKYPMMISMMFVLCGCIGSVPFRESTATAESEKRTVLQEHVYSKEYFGGVSNAVVIRDDGYYGIGSYIRLRINGKAICDLSVNEFVSLKLENGNNEITIGWFWPFDQPSWVRKTIIINVSNGKNYTCRLGYDLMGSLRIIVDEK